MQYKGTELKCTEEELNAFVSRLEIVSSTHEFSETYNGHAIDNPTGDDAALYYVLSVEGLTYLQAHIPFVSGFQAVKADNVAALIADHTTAIVDSLIMAQFAKTKDDEITDLKAIMDMLVVDALGGAASV